jgi:sugar lactone lactonase YvrE
MGNLFGMEPERVRWDCVVRSQAGIGEVPVWSAEDERLYWIDVFEGKLNSSDIRAGTTTTWRVGETIGCYGLIDGAEAALVALHSGLYRLEFRTGDLGLLFPAPYDPSRFRFNDGRCDPRGRFWVGTAPLRLSQGDGPAPVGESAFWCVDGSRLRLGIDGMTIANGIAFNGDGDLLYLADEPSSSILAFSYDLERGIASRRRIFARFPAGISLDGAAVDTEDFYWIALPGAGLIARFGPDGSLNRLLRAPTVRPAMVCFGGPDLRILLVTTMRRGYGTSPVEPGAGAIFGAMVGARGRPEPRVVA